MAKPKNVPTPPAPKVTTHSPAALAILARLAGADNNGAYVPEGPDLQALVGAGHVEVNPNLKDAATNTIAARATDAGRAHHTSLSAGAVAAPAAPKPPAPPAPAVAGAVAAPAAASAFKLIGGIIPPEKQKRGGLREATYPFAQMEVGQSFFVGPSATMPEPWKQLTSTVSSAQRRFAVLNGSKEITRKNKTTGLTETKTIDNWEPTKKFTIGKLDGAPWGYPGVIGAAIFRTA